MGERSGASPGAGKRNTGPVKVLKPEDLARQKTLSERMNLMVENRCEVFIHNLAYLCRKHKLTQAKLCAEKLEGLISSPQLTGYKMRGRDIPISVMALVASAFDLPLEELCGRVLDEGVNDGEEPDGPSGRPMSEYLKYAGTFDLAYFDTSAPVGRNTGSTAAALSRGIVSVFVQLHAVGTASFRVTGILNCTPEERQKVVSYMRGIDHEGEAARGQGYYERVVSESLEGEPSRWKCLYEGELHLTQRMAELSLRQVKGDDVLHLLLHNRAASSSDGKLYQGGLATMMSVSRGAEHMPCIQAGLLLRALPARPGENGERNGGSGCVFDRLQPEWLAQYLYLDPPRVELGEEIDKIVAYMRAIFSDGGEKSAIACLSDEDKKYCLNSFVEKKLTDSMRRNLLSYYKVSLETDSEVYRMIQKYRQS